MTELQQLEGDLRFVRGALTSSERTGSPAGIYFLWAAAVLIGFSLVDFRRELVGPFWAIVGPAGFVASLLIGWRHAQKVGQVSAAEGRRQALHWGGMLAAVALAGVLPARGVVPWEVMNSVILLILAFGYFSAGVHGDRELMWVGVVMGGAYLLVTLSPAYAWTMAGVAIAVALMIAGLHAGRSYEAAP